jgi:hypothetical protein
VITTARIIAITIQHYKGLITLIDKLRRIPKSSMVSVAGHIGSVPVKGVPGNQALTKIGMQGQLESEKEKQLTNKSPNPMG